MPASSRCSSGSRPSASRSPARSRGRAERSATRARMRSTSPTCCSSACSGLVQAGVEQRLDGLQPVLARRARPQRALDPAAQLAAAHRGRGAVEHADQRAVRAAREARVEFEVAARRGVELQRLVALLAADAAQVRQRGLLRVPHVVAAGSPPRRSASGLCARPKPARSRVPNCSHSWRSALPASKCHGGRSRTAPAEPARATGGASSATSNSAGRRRSSSAASASSPVASSAWKRPLASSSHARPKRSPDGEGGEQRVASCLEQRVVRDRARRDDAHDLAFDRALGLRRIADLLADRDRLALAHGAREVGVERLHRHARHRNRLAARLAARGERDVEQPRRPARVVEEQLVEIAHAVEQQHVGVLRLDAQVLLHNGCQFRRVHQRPEDQRKVRENRYLYHQKAAPGDRIRRNGIKSMRKTPGSCWKRIRKNTPHLESRLYPCGKRSQPSPKPVDGSADG